MQCGLSVCILVGRDDDDSATTQEGLGGGTGSGIERW